MSVSNFNSLTPAETERLSILAEECAEVVQIVGKILRHGYESHSPKDVTATTNRELLVREIGDVSFAVKMLCKSGDIADIRITERAVEKSEKIKPYLHHQ